MAAQVTQELVCVLSVSKLVCIVWVCMYGCPLHCTILSSILCFGGNLVVTVGYIRKNVISHSVI